MELSDICVYALTVIAILAALQTPIVERLWQLTKRRSTDPSAWGVYTDSQPIDSPEA